MLSPILLWLVLCVVLLFIETLSFNLYTIWFAAGAIAAFAGGLFGLGLWWQLGLFLIVSALLLFYTRPVVHKTAVAEAEDIKKVIGIDGVVTIAIDNVKKMGEIRAGGQLWQARAIEEMNIEKGVEIVVVTAGGN